MSINWNVVIIVVLAAVAGFASIYIFKFPAHNIVETEAEKIIKDETGFNIDLDLEEDLSCCEQKEEDDVKKA